MPNRGGGAIVYIVRIRTILINIGGGATHIFNIPMMKHIV